MFPIEYKGIWKRYKEAVGNFWTTEEIDLSKDLRDWKKMTEDERHYILHVLAFFAASDGIVNENLAQNFANEVQISEARAFYGFQIAMENIHSEMYSVLLDQFSKGEEKDKLFNAIKEFPCIKRKAEWALKWAGKDCPFSHRVVAFAAVEGIFFSGSFCSIFWLKKRNLMPGLCLSNDFIARDEASHTDFACHLLSLLLSKPDPDLIADIIDEAVEIEKEFVREALPVKLIGINADLMCEYIDFVADRLLLDLGVNRETQSSNPFPWATLIGMDTKTNQFERRVHSYQKSGVKGGSSSRTALKIVDF